MRVCADEIIDLLNVVTLQRIEHDLVLACIACVDKNSLAGRRNYQNRVTVDWSHIKDVNLKFATGSSRRLCFPPGPEKLPT